MSKKEFAAAIKESIKFWYPGALDYPVDPREVRELCVDLGIKQTTLSRLITGDIELNDDFVKRLVKTLGYPARYWRNLLNEPERVNGFHYEIKYNDILEPEDVTILIIDYVESKALICAGGAGLEPQRGGGFVTGKDGTSVDKEDWVEFRRWIRSRKWTMAYAMSDILDADGDGHDFDEVICDLEQQLKDQEPNDS